MNILFDSLSFSIQQFSRKLRFTMSVKRKWKRSREVAWKRQKVSENFLSTKCLLHILDKIKPYDSHLKTFITHFEFERLFVNLWLNLWQVSDSSSRCFRCWRSPSSLALLGWNNLDSGIWKLVRKSNFAFWLEWWTQVDSERENRPILHQRKL